MPEKNARVILKPGREVSVRRQHPWIFSGGIERQEETLTPGDPVDVYSSRGDFLGIGLLGSGGIAVKMLSTKRGESVGDSVSSAIGDACRFRAGLGLLANDSTTMCRLVNGEGDGLPGLIVDRYAESLVVQCHSLGMHRLREVIVEALRAALPFPVDTIYDKSGDLFGGSSEQNVEQPRNQFLVGSREETEAREEGITYRVSWARGQKTGFFIDQRDNRAIVGAQSEGRRVLNLFSYTGGFSLAALKGGASSVRSVDASAGALEYLERNLSLNSYAGTHESVEADCFDFLDRHTDEYDLIVLDPPALAKHQRAVKAAYRAYEQLNMKAAKLLAPGGRLATFSCSQLVSPADFMEAVRRGVGSLGRPFRNVKLLGAAACHPSNLFHPEGSYLKGTLIERR